MTDDILADWETVFDSELLGPNLPNADAGDSAGNVLEESVFFGADTTDSDAEIQGAVASTEDFLADILSEFSTLWGSSF